MTAENQSADSDIVIVLRRGGERGGEHGGEHGGERVELHVMPLDHDHHVMVALAGQGDRPARIKGQGPFPEPGVAIAVARRIAAALEAEGFVRCPGDVCWQMDAWRHRRQVADTRSRFQLRTEFHPDDVLS